MVSLSRSNSDYQPGMSSESNGKNVSGLKEKPYLMKKLDSQPLPVVMDLEEDRVVPEFDTGIVTFKDVARKTESMESSSSKSKPTTPYNIILTGENGTNIDISNVKKV